MALIVRACATAAHISILPKCKSFLKTLSLRFADYTPATKVGVYENRGIINGSTRTQEILAAPEALLHRPYITHG